MPSHAGPRARPVLVADPALRAIAATYAAGGVALPALGPAAARLADETPMPGPVLAAHGAFFGIGLVALGAGVGRLLLGRAGPTVLARAALAAVLAGVALVAVGPAPGATLPGAAAIGCGFALAVLVLPAVIEAHPLAGPPTFADVNALFAVGAVASQLVLVAAEASGISWRAAYLVAAGTAAAVASALLARVALAIGAGVAGRAGPPLPRARAVRVGLGVLLVGACLESVLAFWPATFALEERHDSALVAMLVVLGFALGQLVGRASSRRLDRLVPERLGLPLLLVVAGVGATLLVFVPGSASRLAGAALAGLGTSLVYPRAMRGLFALAPGAGVAVSAAAALTSGLAVALAPLAVGGLAEVAGLGSALAVLPALAVTGSALALASGVTRASTPSTSRS